MTAHDTLPPADPALLAAANRALAAQVEDLRRERDAWRDLVLRIVSTLAPAGFEDVAVKHMTLADGDDLVDHVRELWEGVW